jgi:hypothetical protein
LLRFTRVPRWAGLVGVACVAAFAVAGATAAGGGNHQIFPDPTGDNQSSSNTVYASDIRQVEMTSQNSGAVKFAVTLVDGDAKLVTGDTLDIYIDYDRKQSTGQNGFDLDLVATGHSGSDTTFVLCRLGQLTSCEEGPSGWAHDQKTADKTHVVDFIVTTGVSAFDFRAIETYTPSTTTPLTDIAPNSGLFTFETKADPDNDGLYGTADKCPSRPARGKLDSNNNGCPGPFGVIGTREPHFEAALHPTFLHLSDLRVTGVPPGAKVAFSSPRGGDTAKANSSGAAHSRRAKGDFRYGSVISIKITKPAFVGVFLKVKVNKRQGLGVVRRACIPATGGSPVKCSSALKGS